MESTGLPWDLCAASVVTGSAMRLGVLNIGRVWVLNLGFKCD